MTAPLLARAPVLIVQPRAIAEILNVAEPTPRNWHPTLPMLAKFINTIPEAEETRLLRFTLLTLIFGRPEAVRELTPFQIDERYHLVHLNENGRRQTKKYRATLPMPDSFWPVLLRWREAETIVHVVRTVKKDGEAVIVKRAVSVLRKPWDEVRAAAGLPEDFVPKSLRHMLATELRRRKVPKEERELWQGHRRESTNDHYGRYDPDFMSAAKQAVADLLSELDALCKKPFLRQVSAKPEKAKRKAAAIRIVKS